MKIVYHLLRCALVGMLVLLLLNGLMLTDPKNIGLVDEMGAFLVRGALYGISAALLLLLFRVGPVLKVILGVFCGPALPILLIAPKLAREGKGQELGGLVFLCVLIGLLVGGLDASRVWQRRRAIEAM